MATNDVSGDLLIESYELQKKFNELFRQIGQKNGYPFDFGKLMAHLQSAIEGEFILPIGFKNHPSFLEKWVNGGYVIEVVNEGTCYETILSITSAGGVKYSLNDEVILNRDIFNLKEGDTGVIIEILEPHKNGYSNDILIVKFGDEIFHLKAKEINHLL